MIKRLALWTSVLAVIVALMVAGRPLAAREDLPGTPQDTGEQLVQAADPTSIEVYCDIPNASMPDQRVVGTFVNARAGYGDPTVSFTLRDLSGNVIGGNGPPPVTGPAPLPASNPITAAPPSSWEWGPGGYSQLTVSATYPSLDPAIPDAISSLTISCVPDAPTPTPPTQPTPDPFYTPPPVPTAADYTPQIATEMRDTAGNIIPDDATVSPGTGIFDIATISGLPPGTIGTVFYQLFRDNCRVFVGNIGFSVSVVADANGVAVAPASPVFTVPGFPGGFYDWRIVYADANTGFVYGGCGFETFFVPPPLPPSGTGNARLTCFLKEPPEPGRAGYKVNVSPLPATGTVEVNVTLQLEPNANVFEYKTVTLPPGTLPDLEFYGAYTYAWVSVIFRDDAGQIYAVVNLEGACAATPGPTPTPGPTNTPTSTSTSTPTSTPTATAAGTSVSPTSTPTYTATSTATGTVPSIATGTATTTSTATTTTDAPPRTPAPTSTPRIPVVQLPDTGTGDSERPVWTLLLIVAATVLAGWAAITARGSARQRT